MTGVFELSKTMRRCNRMRQDNDCRNDPAAAASTVYLQCARVSCARCKVFSPRICRRYNVNWKVPAFQVFTTWAQLLTNTQAHTTNHEPRDVLTNGTKLKSQTESCCRWQQQLSSSQNSVHNYKCILFDTTRMYVCELVYVCVYIYKWQCI